MRYIFLFLCSFYLISCDMETVVDLDVPLHEPVLVVNGLLDTDSTAKVVVSHSVGAFSNGYPSFIHNATVLLYKNEEQIAIPFNPDMSDLVYIYYEAANYTIDSLPMYYYKSDYIPEEDATYRIEVNHNDYTTITAETYIPDDIEIKNQEIDTLISDDFVRLTFSFDDNISQQNYYRLKVFSSCVKEWEDECGYIEYYGFRGHSEFMSNDPSFPQTEFIPEDGYTFRGNNVVFTDALFNGQQKTITLDIESELSYIECDTLLIRFSTFSNDSYNYYTSLGDHREKGELGLFGGEVIPVYTNVENGLGIFISTNSQQIMLKPQD